MELKPGYKQTEVGVIPEDWEVRSLQDLCKEEITYGIVQCGPHVPSGIPYIRVSDMDGPILDREKMLCTSSQIASRFRRSEVRHGDIVYALRGRLGDVRSVPLDLDGANLTQGTARISPCLSIHSPFLLWALRNPEVVLRACAESKGTTFMEITLSDLRQIKIALPPRPEQLRISSTLSDIEDHLMTLDLELLKKRNIKQAAMQELLTGKRRLPGFEGEWKTVAISQVAEKITGFWGRTEPGSEAMHYTSVIRAGDISEEGRLIGAARRYLSQHESSLAGCRPGDTVMTASGNGLGKSWTCDQDEVYSASNFVRIIRPQRGKADGYFIGYALKSRRARSKLVEHTATSAYPNLKPSFFNDKWLSLPPEPEQKAISDVLRDIDIEIIELEARKLKAAQLKQGMMQQLLTGKIRLK